MSNSNPQVDFMHCPQCGNQIPVSRAYVTWCDKCDWNLIPNENEEGKNKGDKPHLIKNYWKNQSVSLKAIAQHQEFNKSKVTLSGIVATLISFLIHLSTIMVALLGISVIAKNYKQMNIIPLLLGLFLLFMAWSIRPKMGKAEKIQLSKNNFPATYDFFEKLGIHFNVKIDLIGINGEFNASVSPVGWRQKRQVVIGLPLVSSLSDQDVLALFSHEFAHLTTPDISQTLLVGTALHSLESWYAVLSPQNIVVENTLGSILILPIKAIAWVFCQFIKFFYFAVMLLAFRSHQLSEYRSDIIAAQYAGKQAVLNLFKKLRFRRCFSLAVKNAALSKGQDFDLYKEIKELMDTVPDKEILRLKRVEAKEETHIDDSHPPMIFREEIITSLPDIPAKIQPLEFDFGRMRKELATFNKEIQTYLADNYSKYYQ